LLADATGATEDRRERRVLLAEAPHEQQRAVVEEHRPMLRPREDLPGEEARLRAHIDQLRGGEG
jgi:hypothetical protein